MHSKVQNADLVLWGCVIRLSLEDLERLRECINNLPSAVVIYETVGNPGERLWLIRGVRVRGKEGGE
ncbi:MAG: hypothetical protein QXR87_07580 [Candidatus Hadarchaeales archaeon]